MEVKKSPKVDLENKKALFLEIGLCLSLGLMILVFAISQGKKEIKDLAKEDEFIQVESIEMTRQDQEMPSVPTPAQALSVISEVIRIVDNETQIETEMVFTDFDESTAFNTNPTSSTETYGSDEPFYVVEDMPQFEGGDINKFSAWVGKKVVYPRIATEMGIQGTVVVQFVVERDGSLSGIQVLKSANKMLDDEAIRVVSSSPRWTPGKQRDVPARVILNIPVNFRMQ